MISLTRPNQIAGLMLSAALMCPSMDVHAKASFPNLLPGGFNNQCTTCHTPGGFGRQNLNVFGQEVLGVLGADRNFRWEDVCEGDADNDGASNGLELGDPDCDGQRDPALMITSPSDAADTPEIPMAGMPAAPMAGMPAAPMAGLPSEAIAGMPSVPGAGMPSAPSAGMPSAPSAGIPSAPSAGMPTPAMAGTPTPPNTNGMTTPPTTDQTDTMPMAMTGQPTTTTMTPPSGPPPSNEPPSDDSGTVAGAMTVTSSSSEAVGGCSLAAGNHMPSSILIIGSLFVIGRLRRRA